MGVSPATRWQVLFSFFAESVNHASRFGITALAPHPEVFGLEGCSVFEKS
jgi:hypothetical protein